MKKPKPKIKPRPSNVTSLDSHQLHARALNYLSRTLDELESNGKMPVRERLAMGMFILRGLYIDMQLKKNNKELPNAGSSVRKYSTNFTPTDAGSGRKANTGSAIAEQLAGADDESIPELELGGDDAA